ncbi:Rab-GTPase-TBC domain-containing protein 1 [Elsinoe fawcettii]|nr:Rab-GTPase-TBC domain-containing protein 1 [Elsinoe fawcettii]
MTSLIIHNSVDGEQFTRNDNDATTPPAPGKKNGSKATQSLMSTMMDTEGTEGSLFNEHDLQYFRHHPGVLAHVDNKSLRELSKSQSYFAMIRTLAGDLAQRDADLVLMRKRLEELGKIFKDHLCQEHDLSRLDADRTLHDLTKASKHHGDLTLEKGLEDAVDSPVADNMNPFSDSNVAELERVPSSTPSEPVSSRRGSDNVTGPNGTVKGMLSMFGGRQTVKANKASKPTKKKDVPLAAQLNSAKASMYHKRKSSIGSNASSKNLVSAPAGPVEMNAIVETENLPPPLTSQRDIQAQYPGYSADVYGFVIDSTRIGEFMDKNRISSPKPPSSKGADTPITSASSIKSMPESENEGEIPEVDQQSWTNYLKFDASSLGSLSWLPIASTTSITPEEGEGSLDSPTEMGQSDAVKLLQNQLSDDFTRLQKARLIPWEKFLNTTQPTSDSSSTSYMPALFRRNTSTSLRSSPNPDIPPQLASLPASLRADRTRLVLSGIPMALRSQIYTSIALETLQPDPDTYRTLVASSATAVDPSLLAEIEDDIPRTLPNNVFFRPSHPLSRRPSHPNGSSPAASSPSTSSEPRGRSALRELLLAFLTRRPEIGYCQGMNLIAGYLLLISPTTEAAFWVFTYLVEHVLADIYFDATLRGASIEICVLRSFIDELIPRLGRRLEEYGVEGRESAPYNWFLTAYASALGVEGVFRVWDVLLGLPNRGGTGFLVRLGVGMCKVFEEEMLALEGGFEIRGFMDSMGLGGVGREKGEGDARVKGERGRRRVGIDGLVKAAWMLGGKIKDEEVRRRRRFFALRVDESALG